VTYAWWLGRERAHAYFALMLFLTGAVVGVFVAQDLILFYAFFEAMLIPLYVLIGVWGGPGRLGATLKFVVYTVAGSLLMLAAIIVYGLQQGTFDLTELKPSSNEWLFLGFMIAFAVKAPLFPFHGWLPDAYREAPPEVSAMLSGVVSKVAAYGFLRIVIVKFRGRRTTGACRSWCSPRSGSSTDRCSPSAHPTSAAWSRTRRWRRWG
jgi:NADH-quinone oxidoreductase subunit M